MRHLERSGHHHDYSFVFFPIGFHNEMGCYRSQHHISFSCIQSIRTYNKNNNSNDDDTDYDNKYNNGSVNILY